MAEYLTDDEQLEEVKRVTREYAPVLVIGALLGAGGLFGWRYYNSHQTEMAEKAADQFDQMSQALQLNDEKKSRSLADGLIKDFSGTPYADQAQLVLARIDIDTGHGGDAVAPLTAVMNGSKDSELKLIARSRLARVLIDQGKPDDAIQMLAAVPAGKFAGAFHQVHGDALLAKKDVPGAVSEYQAALAAADSGGVDSGLVQMKLADLGANDKPQPTLKATP